MRSKLISRIAVCVGFLPLIGCPGGDGGTTEGGSESSTTGTTEATGSTTSMAPTTTGVDSIGTTSGSTSSTGTTTLETTTTTTTSGTTGTSSGTSTGPICDVGELGCACDGDQCMGDLFCHEGVCVELGVLKPLPPDDVNFMWQNLQTDFIDDQGIPCKGRVTAAIADQATCFVASDGELKCAGRVFQTVWGPTFTGTGVMNADQVTIAPTFNAEDGNGMCVLADGVIQCMGRNNNTGKYGTGATLDVPALTPWGKLTDVVRMGTGTWDQHCALLANGDIHCSGIVDGMMSLDPVLKTSGASHFWIDTFGALKVDDAAVFRASQGRTECHVDAAGLSCTGMSFGPAGEVVDGGIEFINNHICWLTSGGDVACDLDPTPFEPGRVLALVINPYTASMCAVYDDASLWCVGPNEQGKLGTGDEAPLGVETEVQPAGSVRIDCK